MPHVPHNRRPSHQIGTEQATCNRSALCQGCWPTYWPFLSVSSDQKKKIYTYTPLCESLLLETRPHSGQDISVRFQIEHWSLTHWTNENRRGCFKSRVESNIEQSANTIPGFEQQQCSHFPPCCSLCRQRFLC